MTHSPTRKRLVRAGAALAALLVLAFGGGLFLDVRAFDRTQGGYEAPYTDFTGTPTDWSRMASTPHGMRADGHVLTVHIDCTTGMMEFELLGIRFPFREFSERALVVHRPREACIERGFAPAFGAPAAD